MEFSGLDDERAEVNILGRKDVGVAMENNDRPP